MACHTLCHRGQASVKRNWWGSRTKKLLKNMAAASKSRTFAPSASFFFFFFLPLLQPFFSFLFWCRARPNKRQRFAWCVRPLPSCSSLEVCVCPRLHVAVCIWVCARVLMCAGWLPASLSCKRRVEGGEKKAYRYLTQQSGKYAQICDRRGASLGMHL